MNNSNAGQVQSHQLTIFINHYHKESCIYTIPAHESINISNTTVANLPLITVTPTVPTINQ